MSRIPRAEIDRIRDGADLAAFVRAAGVELTRKGNQLAGRCPFHTEGSPSFFVARKPTGRQFFKCFGCGKYGDIFDFVGLTEGLAFDRGVVAVAERSGQVLPASLVTGTRSATRRRIIHGSELLGPPAADLESHPAFGEPPPPEDAADWFEPLGETPLDPQCPGCGGRTWGPSPDRTGLVCATCFPEDPT